MSYDAHANLAITNVATAPSPSTTGTSLTVTTGAGSLFPATPFNCTIYPPSTIPTQSSAEIIRVTAVVGDVLTITRAQEGTTAKAIKAGWLIANTATAITFTDIEDSIIQFISAGTTKASASEVIFSNANGVSFGADGQTITASVAGAGAGSVSFSAGTESAALDSIVFSNSNGVSFGLDGSTMTASIVPGAAAISFSAGTKSATLDSIVFSNSNGVSFGLAGSTITASVGAGGAAGSISAGTASVALGQVIFSNSNGISFGLNGSTVTASVAGGAGSVNFSGGTTSNNLASITFSNSNGISFGLDAGTMTASHNALTSQSNQAASASNGSFAFQTLGFSNANNVTFGTSAGSIITASVATIAAAPVNFSAGTTSNNIGSIVFSNSNGISFGLNGSTITASASGAGAAFASFYQNEPLVLTQTLFGADVSTIYFTPFMLPYNLSASYARFPGLFTTTQTNLSTLASSMNASAEVYSTYAAVIYSLGTGASSNSLMTVAKASALWTVQNSISVATNGSEASYTQAITGANSGNVLNFSRSYALSTTVYSFSSANFLNSFTSQRYFDLNFASTLAPGYYWLGLGYGSDSSAGSARVSAATKCAFGILSFYGQRATGNFFMPALGATESLAGWQFAGFQISTAAGLSIPSVNFDSAVVNASGVHPIFQLIRQA